MALPTPPPPPPPGAAATRPSAPPPPPGASKAAPPPPPMTSAPPKSAPPPAKPAVAAAPAPTAAVVNDPPPFDVEDQASDPTPQESQAAAPTQPTAAAAPVATPPAPPAPPAASSSTEMATAQQGGDMTAAVPGGGALADSLAEQGFEGLDFGFGSLPLISLDQGVFKSTEGTTLGNEFYCCVISSRPKYLFKTDVADTDPRSAIAYSYDGFYSVKGDSIEELIKDWASKGCGYKKMTYLEVAAKMQDENMALLSIPPSSVRRFSAVMGNMYSRRLPYETTWLRVFQGERVTNVAKPFYPWAFSVFTGA